MRDSSEMYPLVLRWKESDLSKRMFCKQESLSESVFNYWIGHYKKGNVLNERNSGFVPLKVERDETRSEAGYMEIRMKSGAQIKFHQPPSKEELTLILRKC